MHGPDASLAVLIELPLALSLAVAAFVAWVLRTPLPSISLTPGRLVATFAGVTVLHEAIHTALLPGGSAVSTWPHRSRVTRRSRRANVQPPTRLRYVSALLLPLLLLSFLPAIIAPQMRESATAFFVPSIVNALLSSDDVLVAILMLVQIPANARVRRQGNEILWQPRGNDIHEPACAAPFPQQPPAAFRNASP